MIDEIDFDQTATTELAGEDRVTTVDREIRMVDAGAAWGGNRLLRGHCVGIEKVEPFAPLGDDNCRMAVGRKIKVVGVIDRYRLAGPACLRVDRRQATGGSPIAVVGHPQSLQIP